MSLPLIKRIKNQFSFIKKNFTDINRYNSIFNKYQSLSPKYSTNDTKTNIFNTYNMSLSQKNNQLNSTTRNINNKYYHSNIFKNNNFYFSYLSPTRSHSKFNFTTFTKNINTSNNSIFPGSSHANDLNSEKRILKSNLSSPNMMLPSKKEMKKIDKILTKFKLNKIISDNSHNNCYIQEIKNNLFLDRYKRKILSDKYINSQINKHKHFLFDKNENSIRKMKNYLINIDNSNTLKENFSSEDIIKSLNKKEIKLIKADVAYFKDINENILKDLMNIQSNSICLIDILNKEEQKEGKNENIKNIKIKKPKINMEENIIYNYDKYINKIINKDLTQRLKKLKINKEDKKLKNILDNYSSKINIDVGKLGSEKNIKSEDRCFQTFMIRLKDRMKKQYYINRNRERLTKEKSFQYQKELKIKKEGNEKAVIRNCLVRYRQGLVNN